MLTRDNDEWFDFDDEWFDLDDDDDDDDPNT